MNVVLQIIAKFYPDIFENQDSKMAVSGQKIVDKIKDDQDYANEEEARECSAALLEADELFKRGEQEDAAEALSVILKRANCASGVKIFESLSTAPKGRKSGQPDNKPEESTFPYIPISIVSSGTSKPEDNIDLGACLERFCAPEDVEFADSVTGKARKQSLLGLPNLLAVQMKRFDNSSKKIRTNITGTLRIVVPKHIQYSGHGVESSDLYYHLQGFIVHIGVVCVLVITSLTSIEQGSGGCIMMPMYETLHWQKPKKLLDRLTCTFIVRLLNTLPFCPKSVFY